MLTEAERLSLELQGYKTLVKALKEQMDRHRAEQSKLIDDWRKYFYAKPTNTT